MNIIDISWPITHDVTEYKDRTTVELKSLKDFGCDGMRETLIAMHNHTGTHIDAQSHFLADGRTSESIPLEALIGICRVLDMSHVTECITREDLLKHTIKHGERILFKTKNSNLMPIAPFDPCFVYVRDDAAQYLASIGVVCVGIDYLGIERNQPDRKTHKELLSAGVVIIEGLRLKEVAAGEYQLYCLPLNIFGIDGVPARAVLLKR